MTEAAIQQQIVVWFNNNYCTEKQDVKCLIFSVPNDVLNIKERFKKSAMGLRAGVSDLVVVMKNRVFFVEIKTKTGKIGKKQAIFGQKIADLGFNYYIIRSLEEFQSLILAQ